MSRSWRRREYATPTSFGSFVLKTAGSRFAVFGLQNLGEDLDMTHGIIGELALRRSFLMKGVWVSDARNSTWMILPLWLNGFRKYLGVVLEMCDCPIKKMNGYPRQLSLPSRSLAQAAKVFIVFGISISEGSFGSSF
jgi:hypothetical protein